VRPTLARCQLSVTNGQWRLEPMGSEQKSRGAEEALFFLSKEELCSPLAGKRALMVMGNEIGKMIYEVPSVCLGSSLWARPRL